ncbi:hypothetical protein DBV15_09658 [Temnothorax longispinosus]|uniref:Uncharacterized protein n=1 Tax=Temnothorax longispinosus TaxID=300112 RepID=A0A4S2KA73_9HYME|nr:hypothetical protein DBV15_09658 [Temnothorax longispinosus]
MKRLYAVPSEKLWVWMVWLTSVGEVEPTSGTNGCIDLIVRIAEPPQMAANDVPEGTKIESVPDMVGIPKLHIHQFAYRSVRIAAALNLAHHLTDGLHVTFRGVFHFTCASRVYGNIYTMGPSALSAGILAFVEGRTGRDAGDETTAVTAAASETAKETAAAARPIRARWQRLRWIKRKRFGRMLEGLSSHSLAFTLFRYDAVIFRHQLPPFFLFVSFASLHYLLGLPYNPYYRYRDFRSFTGREGNRRQKGDDHGENSRATANRRWMRRIRSKLKAPAPSLTRQKGRYVCTGGACSGNAAPLSNRIDPRTTDALGRDTAGVPIALSNDQSKVVEPFTEVVTDETGTESPIA